MPDDGTSSGGGGNTGGGGLRYEPLEPTNQITWRYWWGWLFRSFGRLGRGVELAAAGVLVSGAVVTWHFAGPFGGAAAAAEQGTDDHTCCCQRSGGDPARGAPAAPAAEVGSREAAPQVVLPDRPTTTSRRDSDPRHHGEQGEPDPVRRARKGGMVVTV